MPEASAPGKLVIVGEYAVLEGAPAIATAVDVRARVSVSRVIGPDGVLIDQVSGQKFFFLPSRLDGLIWKAEPPGPRGTILEAVMATLKDKTPDFDKLAAFSVVLNTNDFYSNDRSQPVKLGLGSSAAVLVALTGALTSFIGLVLDDREMRAVCHAAHRRFQAGQGSGIDVAASLMGGVVGMRASRPDSCREANPLSWPAGLHMLPVWTGNSASTTRLLSRFTGFCKQNPESFRTHLERLRKLAETASAVWMGGSVTQLLEAISDYDAALRVLDSDASIGIETPIHSRLRQLSRRHGATYKISGAGGGDFGITFADSESVILSVKREFEDEGFFVLDRRLDADGLTIAD